MTIHRLSVLQWLGFVAGGAIWFASFLAGTGVSIAACNPAGARWGIAYDPVQLALSLVAAACVCAAEAAAVVVFRATRDAEDADPAPPGRLRFFAVGAMLGNLVFFVIIILTGVATIVDRACHQS